MANDTTNPNAVAAANMFNGVVDAEVMKNLAKAVLPDLKGFGAITHSNDTRVVALANEDMSRGAGKDGFVIT